MTREPRPDPTRPIRMRLMGTVLTTAVIALTAACGSSSSPVATGEGVGTPTPGTSVPGARVVLVSLTAAGGRVTTQASPLDTPAQVRAFARQFRMPAFDLRLEQALRRLGNRRPVVGAVVANGCDIPPGVDVVYGEGTTVRLLPHEVASPLQECLAPVTTVALASVPGAD